MRCSNCGAPLPQLALPGQPVRCPFCTAMQDVGPARTRAPLAPTSANANAAKAAKLQWAVALAFLVLSVGISAVRAMVRPVTPATPATPSAPAAPLATEAPALDVGELARLSLAISPQSLATLTHGEVRTGGVGDRSAVDVTLKGTPYTEIDFEWAKGDPSHVSFIRLDREAAGPDVVAVRGALSRRLGRRLQEGMDFRWADVSFEFHDTTVAIIASAPADRPADVRWKQQVDALWDVVRAEVLGLPVPILDGALLDLGRGYPLASLGSVDLGTTVESAPAALERLYPAGRATLSSDLVVALPIAHPLFCTADLYWPDKTRARLHTASFSGCDDDRRDVSQPALEACMHAAFGPRSRGTEPTPLRPEHESTWVLPAGGAVDVVPDRFRVNLDEGKARMSPATWAKVLTILGECRAR